MKTRLILIIAFTLLSGCIYSQDNKASVSLAAAIYEEEVTGNLEKAVELYLDILKNYPDDRVVSAKTLYHLGLVNEKMGRQKAREYFTRLVNTYPDQTEVVAMAKARLTALGGSAAAGGLSTRRVLTDASGIDGTLTSDGKYIMSMDLSTGDVVQYDISSGKRIRIKNLVALSQTESIVEEDAIFSRNGQHIVYSTEEDSDSTDLVFSLRSRDLDGSDLHVLYSGQDYVRPLAWSSDEVFILAAFSRDNSDEITLISASGGSERLLKKFASDWNSLRGASFTPDGRFVAFSLDVESTHPNNEIFLISTDGRNEAVIAGHPAEDILLGLTPDGRRLVFLSDRSGTSDIWAVSISEGKQMGEPVLLKKDFGKDSEFIGFTPESSLYYKSFTYSGGLYQGEVDLETGKILAQPVLVKARYTSPPDQLTWSPDGKSLLYIPRLGNSLYIPRLGNSFRANNLLTIRSTSTGEERILSPRLRYINQISWAPDSRSILGLGIEETKTGIFRIDSETGSIVKLGGVNHFSPHLCLDGKTLVFIKAGPIISKENLDTGEALELVKVAPTRSGYDLSPDGHEVVFQVDHTIKIISISGGESRELFRDLTKNAAGWWEYDLKWTRDGRYIIARSTTQKIDGNQIFMSGSEIWSIPVQGGTPLKLDLSVTNMVSFAIHPDNRHFVFSVNEGTREELWVMENLLPE